MLIRESKIGTIQFELNYDCQNTLLHEIFATRKKMRHLIIAHLINAIWFE